MSTTASNAQTNRMTVLRFLRSYGQIAVLVLLALILSLFTPRMFTEVNLMNLARQTSIIALVAAGQTLIVLTGAIDLSVGAVLALCAVIFAGLLQGGYDLPVALAGALFVGALAGLVNGVLVARFRLASFVVTLATLSVAKGLTLLYTGASPIAITSEIALVLGQARWFGIPAPIWLAIGVYVLLWFIMRATIFGRYVYAIGGNEEAAILAAVPVTRYKIYVFLLAGVLTGFAGVVLASRLGSAVPTAGDGMELVAITAVVLGGTSLLGGEGRIWATIVGAALLNLISNALNLLNVNSYYQAVATGCIVAIAVLADRYLRSSTRK
ncbi:ribose transport system permease protein [Xaviernesmea oryzae]|uniref:Ribose transport system permease protein n=1 Tax=Xaviernesmea oryzae TaxID=464029 RepID=A0A1X7DX92_9HYPH|nr:ABC transporter permease [Xaviernesmea oryzae]SMF23274.1 ribose transport system permease protein [Xaviernesmea oryzae]